MTITKKFNVALKMGLVVIAMCLHSFAHSKSELNDYTEVAATIKKYFDGTQYGKQGLVKEAFTDTLFIQWIDKDGAFRSRGAASYIERIEEGKHTPRYGHIVSMDVTNNAAGAKVEIEWGDRRITDYILLLKIDGKWKITNKIATIEQK